MIGLEIVRGPSRDQLMQAIFHPDPLQIGQKFTWILVVYIDEDYPRMEMSFDVYIYGVQRRTHETYKIAGRLTTSTRERYFVCDYNVVIRSGWLEFAKRVPEFNVY